MMGGADDDDSFGLCGLSFGYFLNPSSSFIPGATGKWYNNSTWIEYGSEATGKQDSSMIGYPSDKSYPRNGTILFSNTNYWYDGTKLKGEYGTSYPAYVYDDNASIKIYVDNYAEDLNDSSIVNPKILCSFVVYA